MLMNKFMPISFTYALINVILVKIIKNTVVHEEFFSKFGTYLMIG